MDYRDDPRIATSTVIGGPPDLVGSGLVICDEVTINGRYANVPRPLPGVTEYVAVARAEARADELLKQLLGTLVPVDNPPALWQPDATLVVEMRAAAETVVTSAVVGLEAFASHHVRRLVTDPGVGTIAYDGEEVTPQEIRNRFSLDERYKVVLPKLLGRSSPAQTSWWPLFRGVQGLAALTRHAIDEPIKRSGLEGEKPLAERFYTGEYRGAGQMLLDVYEYFSPGWIGDGRLLRLRELAS